MILGDRRDFVKILTLIKYSLDIAEIKVDPATRQLHLESAPAKVGNIDKNVAEAAVRLKTTPEDAVWGLCLGPAAARESFRDVLAMGVDEVILVEDPFEGQGDAAAVAQILEAALRKIGPFDLLLCGFASDDGYTFQVGPRLAERLGLPLVAYARKLDVEGGKLRAERDLDENVQVVTAALPAVVSVAEEAFPPRRTTLMDAIKAKKKPVSQWTVGETLGISAAEMEHSLEPEVLSQEGIVVQRKQRALRGTDMAEVAERLIDALLQENVLKEN